MPALSAQDRVFSEIIQTEGGGTVFAPENIFWNPESKHVGKNWQALWNKSLDIGAAILAAGFQSERKWSPDEFRLDYNNLRAAVKTDLFGQAPAATPAEDPSDDQFGDPAIADILNRLLAKWRREIRSPATVPTEEDTETIILPRQQAAQDLAETVVVSPNAPVKDPLSSGPPDDEEETLIMPPQNRFARKSPETELPDEELIQETVILTPGNSAATPARVDSINSDMGPEDLPETVVLSPGGRPKDRSDYAAQTYLHDNQTNIHQQPDRENSQLQKGAEKKEDPSQDDDILTETVILRPEKNRGSKNE
jgi:hypothetical protein